MNKPEIIIFAKYEYYLADDLFDCAKIFCKGSRNGRQLIDKHQIPEKDYVYARKDDDGNWIATDGDSKKFDKVLISKTYAEKYIPEFSTTAKYDVDMAPPILVLKKKEKFKDQNGNVIEIEVRGDRIDSEYFFKVEDVSIKFGLKSLYTTIIDKNTGYEENIHYKYFICETINNTKNQVIKKNLFLTYGGLLRVMFVSRSPSAEALTLWATETLFTVQLGDKSNKQKLAAKLLGVDTNTIKNVFNKSVSTMPCIYLFELGTLNNDTIRKSFQVDEDDYTDKTYTIGKFGLTDDLPKRSSEHEATYGIMNGVNIKLIMFQYIDPLFLSKAETLFKHLVKKIGISFQYKNHKELIAYNKADFKFIQEQFEMIGNKYRGRVAEIIDINKELKHQLDIIEEKHKNKINDLKHKLAICEEKQLNKIALLEKDIEILKLKQKK